MNRSSIIVIVRLLLSDFCRQKKKSCFRLLLLKNKNWKYLKHLDLLTFPSLLSLSFVVLNDEKKNNKESRMKNVEVFNVSRISSWGLSTARFKLWQILPRVVFVYALQASQVVDCSLKSFISSVVRVSAAELMPRSAKPSGQSLVNAVELINPVAIIIIRLKSEPEALWHCHERRALCWIFKLQI